MFGHGEPLPFGPGTNLAAPLPARCRSCPRARPLQVHHTCMFHKWSKLAAELSGVPRTQIDLILRAVHAELHGLVGRAASQVVLKMHFDPLHYFPPNCVLRLAADPIAELALRRHSLPRTDVSRTVLCPSRRPRCCQASDPSQGTGRPEIRHAPFAEKKRLRRAVYVISLLPARLLKSRRSPNCKPLRADDTGRYSCHSYIPLSAVTARIFWTLPRCAVRLAGTSYPRRGGEPRHSGDRFTALQPTT